MKILITEMIREEGINELKNNHFEVHYDETLWENREKLLNQLPHFDALIVRNQTKVDKELLEVSSNLKVIGRLGVGLDNIDLQAAKNKGIRVVYAKNANATSVAEYVMTAILLSSRPLHLAHEDVKVGNWNRSLFTGKEISSKILGLVGLGEISLRVAKRAQAFGMTVVGYDPFISDYDYIFAETNVKKYSSLDNLLEVVDFMSLHVPLTPSTKHLISHNELKKMKKTSYLINTSRGGIIDEYSLSVAIKNGEIAGAYLDVLESEPIEPTNNLLTLNNVYITPHIAGLTKESQKRTSLLIAKEVGKILHGQMSLCEV
ncbi:hydroxyacid dehydrogenase [Fervidibacillus albus]|uniref:Hydroxyacid dehydrogenase n=1 Tax=Fervidibacillus albus TaxID=2980026 RepID=A0A9E8LSX0_9BACI|nr:hydroxyacid dehydrogenase [Fervidibacillus albus]WAA09010.1 hydroxyacid dehydrogenase [Fervidibacillus albus]